RAAPASRWRQPAHADRDAARARARWAREPHDVPRSPAPRGVRAHSARIDAPTDRARAHRLVRGASRGSRRSPRSLRRAGAPLAAAGRAARVPSLMRVSTLVHAVDAHACGEHGRVIVGGVLDVPGDTMYDKMCHLRDHADGLRKRMLREPRGYPAANCNLILPSSNPEADAGYVIMEQVEYPGMSGTNTICVTTVLLETGMLPMSEPGSELH